MNPGGFSDQQGTVLFLTLIILSVLMVVVIHGMRTMQVTTAGATMFRNGIQAERLAISGIRLAQVLLYQDMVEDRDNDQAVDTLLEDWARFPATRNVVIPEITIGEIGLEIVDEQGKYPINRLAEAQTPDDDVARTLETLVATLLETSDLGGEEAGSLARYVVWGLKDWMDRDAQTSVPMEFQNGQWVDVETLDGCRNAPLTDVTEIRLVLERLGLDADLVDFLFNGNQGTPPGLRDLVSVMHSAGVNINTAHPLILQAMARDVEKDVAQGLAMAMDAFRRETWNEDALASSDWYRELAVEGSAFVTFPDTVTRSAWFAVRSTGRVGAISRTGWAVLHRNEQTGSSPSIRESARLVHVAF